MLNGFVCEILVMIVRSIFGRVEGINLIKLYWDIKTMLNVLIGRYIHYILYILYISWLCSN